MKDPSFGENASSILDVSNLNLGGDAGGGLETGHIDDVFGHGHCKSLIDGDLIS